GVVSFFFSSRRRHTRFSRDWSSDVCSSDLITIPCYFCVMNNFRTKLFRPFLFITILCGILGACNQTPPKTGTLMDFVPQNASVRSEEHTSELQSRENLVCRLLLEKKNTSIR